MLVSELPESTNLMLVRVILPDDVLEKYVNYLGGEKEMYVVGFFMGDWFMSPTPSSKEERRLYPMPVSVYPHDILGWEVAEILPGEPIPSNKKTND